MALQSDQFRNFETSHERVRPCRDTILTAAFASGLSVDLWVERLLDLISADPS